MTFKLSALFKRRVPDSESSTAEAEGSRQCSLLERAAHSLNVDDPHQAVAIYDALLAQGENLVEVHYKRANALMRLGQWESALAGYERCIELKPDYANAHCNRGTALERLQQWEEAVSSYEKAAALNPTDQLSFYNRGSVLAKLERFEEALISFERAIDLNNADAAAYFNRGNVLQKLKRHEDALASFDASIEIDPGNVAAWVARGLSLAGLQRHELALVSYRRAIDLKADFVDAFVNAGASLRHLLRLEGAMAAYDKAISLDPTLPEAFLGRGLTSFLLKRYEAAIGDYDRSLAIKTDQPFILGLRCMAKLHGCDWTNLQADVQLVKEGLSIGVRTCIPFEAINLIDSPALHRVAAELWVDEMCPVDHRLGVIAARRAEAKIKIGYFSADFHEHPVAVLAAQLFELHDRSKFEVVAFAFGVDGAGEIRERMRRSFDRFIDVRERPDVEVAALAREIGIDIAVDLGGHTEHSRSGVFALRAAPIQVNYLGFPGTMGASFMDYMIADRVVLPEADVCNVTEKVAFLPHCYLPHDSTRQIAQRVYRREELGLADGDFVFCCFNNSYKITPEVFGVWMRILRRTPGSVLWLSATNSRAAANLRREAVERGVDADRLVFAARFPSSAEHLARHRAADLFLDTLPYNAHATAIDALWAGLPIVTRCGSAFAGRVGTSLLRAVGLPELVTKSTDGYEDLAVDLASNPEKLSTIRQRLMDGRAVSPLFDSARFVRNVENAFEQMHARRQSGLQPAHIYVEGC